MWEIFSDLWSELECLGLRYIPVPYLNMIIDIRYYYLLLLLPVALLQTAKLKLHSR